MPILQAESATAICQRALGWAEHRNTFESLEDGSTLANKVRLRYDIRRRAVLEALDWGFARRREMGQPIEVSATPQNHPSAWARPEDCLRVRGVMVAGRLVEQVVEEVIYTPDYETVQIVFTADKTNPALFPPSFTAALEFLLASEFAMVYARSVNRSTIMLQHFRQAMNEADRIEAVEWGETQAYEKGSWVDAIETPWMGGHHG